MKNLRLSAAAIVLAAVGSWAVAHACEKDKSAQASAASHPACTAEMAKNCTPAQAATCGARGAAAAAMTCDHGGSAQTLAASGCPMYGATATTAEMRSGSCSGHAAPGTRARAASAASGCPYVNGKCVKTGTAGPCPKGAGVSAATAGSCRAHGAGSGAATAAGVGAGTVEAVAVGAGSCGSHEATKTSAVHAGGPGCSSSRSASAGAGCDACSDWVTCASEIEGAGAGTQVVRLKNGVMYVYIADTPAKVHVVQAALARRHDHLAAMEAAGDKVRLCPECKAMRGAAVSGKLVHEVINIEGGCITLLTSKDPTIVSRIYAQAGVSPPARAKS